MDFFDDVPPSVTAPPLKSLSTVIGGDEPVWFTVILPFCVDGASNSVKEMAREWPSLMTSCIGCCPISCTWLVTGRVIVDLSCPVPHIMSWIAPGSSPRSKRPSDSGCTYVCPSCIWSNKASQLTRNSLDVNHAVTLLAIYLSIIVLEVQEC